MARHIAEVTLTLQVTIHLTYQDVKPTPAEARERAILKAKRALVHEGFDQDIDIGAVNSVVSTPHRKKEK